MTGIFYRRTVGYTNYLFNGAAGAIASGASRTHTMSSGPGEILGFGLLRYAGLLADFVGFHAVITVDGTVVVHNSFGNLLMMNCSTTKHLLMGTVDQQSASLTAISFAFRMGYNSSASIVFENTSANSVSVGSGVHYRRGP